MISATMWLMSMIILKTFVDRNQSYEYCVVDDDENIDESLLTKSEKTKEAADQRPA